MSKLIIIKSRSAAILNVDSISAIVANQDTDIVQIIVLLLSGKSVLISQFRSKNAKSVTKRVIEKLYDKIRSDEYIIDMNDIIEEAKKEEDESKSEEE